MKKVNESLVFGVLVLLVSIVALSISYASYIQSIH